MSKYRVMVVDNDPDIRFVVTNLLGSDFETVQAENGLDALEKLERYEPDLLLLDVQMPVMNGFAACRSIRREEAFAETPIFILTGDTTEETRRKSEEAGCAAFIEKPFDTGDLIERIRSYFTAARLTPRIKLFTMRELARIDATPLKAHIDTVADDQSITKDDSARADSKITAKLDHKQVAERLATSDEGRKRRVFGAKPAPPAPPPATPPAREAAPTPPPRPAPLPKPVPPAVTPVPAPKPEVVSVPATQPKPEPEIAQPAVSAAAADSPPAKATRVRVMCLIQDREELLAYTSAMKGRAEFLPLEDPVEAVEIIARYQPDILFMAVQSAQYSGLQIAQLLQTNMRLSHIQPVFLVSGREGETQLRSAQRLTRIRFLSLPLTDDNIRRAIDEVQRLPGFQVREKKLAYGKYVDEVLKKQRGQRESVRKELEKEAFAAQHASLVPAIQDALKQFQPSKLRTVNDPTVHTIK